MTRPSSNTRDVLVPRRAGLPDALTVCPYGAIHATDTFFVTIRIARSPAFRVLELGDPELGKVLETYVAEETLAASS